MDLIAGAAIFGIRRTSSEASLLFTVEYQNLSDFEVFGERAPKDS